MRQVLYILTILVFLISCKNDFKKNSSDNENNLISTEVIDFDANFNKWLDDLDLDHENIIDTTIERAFELWSYKDKLTRPDSIFHWYPSKDSSYYLITNFNRKTKNRISTEYSNNIDLRFLDRSNEEVYIGLMLLDSIEQRSIDFYWYDSTTFFFTENPGENGDRTLTKLKMGVDSIWTYKIEKLKNKKRHYNTASEGFAPKADIAILRQIPK